MFFEEGMIYKLKRLSNFLLLDSLFYILLFNDFVERMRLELITSTLPVSRSSQMS